MSTRKEHVIWQLGSKSLRNSRRAITKARLMTGTFLLQSNYAKFSEKASEKISDFCTLCDSGTEGMFHFLFRCHATETVRSAFLPKLIDKLSHIYSVSVINRILGSKDLLVQLIVDIGKLSSLQVISLSTHTLHTDLEELSMIYCNILYSTRQRLLKRGQQGQTDGTPTNDLLNYSQKAGDPKEEDAQGEDP